VSVPITIICVVPSFGLTTDEADLRRTNVTWGGLPRSYQVTPKVLGRRRATRAKPVRPAGRRLDCESARRQPENKPHGSDINRPAASETMTVTLDFADLWSEPRADLSTP